jgi:DNA-binding GntR family transcriptional regulator
VKEGSIGEVGIPKRSTPAHKKLSGKLRSEILAGKYSADAPLPTETMLCEAHRVSRFTVRQALETLVSEGLIYRRAGSGTYLTGLHQQRQYVRVLGSIEDLLAIGEETRFIPEHPLRLESSRTAAERLRLERGEVWVTRGVRQVSGTPFGYWEIYLPPEVGALMRDRITGDGNDTVIGQIQQNTDVRVSRAEQVVSSEAADAHLAEVLGIPVESPVLRIDRLYLDQAERPVEWAVSTYGHDQYKYRIDLVPRSNPGGSPRRKGAR